MVDVLPVEPVMATTRAGDRRRTSAAIAPRAATAESTQMTDVPGTGVSPRRTAVPDANVSRSRRTAAAPAATAASTNRAPCVRSPGRATKRSPGCDSARVDRHARHGRDPARRRAARDGGDLARRERDHAAPAGAGAPRAPPSRSSNGTVRSASSWPCSCPLPAMTTTSPGAGQPDGALDRRPAVDLDVHREAGGDVGDDRGRILAARIVGRDDRDVGQRAERPRPSAGACRGRDLRRTRRRRSAAPW